MNTINYIDIYKELKCEKKFDDLMGKHTSFGIGGKADIIIYPRNMSELKKVAHISRKHKHHIFVVGAGTNLLVRDKGIRGVVLSMVHGFQNIEIVRITQDEVQVICGAGLKLSRFLKFCADNGLGGAEFLAGIPGTLGGALKMNAGTSSGEIGQIVKGVRVMDLGGRTKTYSSEDMKFTYRSSNFPKGSIIVNSELSLKKIGKNAVNNNIKSIMAERKKSQNIFYPNAGSIFKNPSGKRAFKIIDEIKMRGEKIGSAEVSMKHTNYIINKGGATAKDVISLINKIKRKAKTEKGVTLEVEINIVGEMTKVKNQDLH